MSIPFSGKLSVSRGVLSSIAKELRSLTLKPVKRVTVKFDPFSNNSNHTRSFLFHLSGPKILETNPSCKIKPQVVSDRSEPNILFDLSNGEKIIFKSSNLTNLELLQLYNKHITPLAPAPDSTTTVIATKGSKAAVAKKRK